MEGEVFIYQQSICRDIIVKIKDDNHAKIPIKPFLTKQEVCKIMKSLQ